MVYVKYNKNTIDELAATLGLNWAQLSGYESLQAASAIRCPVVKVIRFDGHSSETDWLAQPATDQQRRPLLVDAHVAGSFGGAGVCGDWQQAAALARRWPIWLAGGLTPDNVAHAVKQVRPRLVDVSSGVERDGMKDIVEIERFIRAAKQIAAASAHV